MKILQRYKILNKRSRIILKNSAGSVLIKGMALIISFIAMPLYMRIFPDFQIFGIWLTLISIIGWILTFDLGIGNGLRNHLSISLSIKDMKAAREYISSAYWMIGIIAAILIILGILIIGRFNWNTLFNISEKIVPLRVLRKIILNIYIGIVLQLFLRLVSSILHSLQLAAVNNLIPLLSNLLQLGVIILLPAGEADKNLQILSFAYIFTTNMPLLFITIVVFNRSLKDCKPDLKFFRINKAKQVLSLGGVFLICQFLFMGIMNTNEFLITKYSSASDVVDYRIYYKLFSLGSTLFLLSLTPIWSAVSNALGSEQYVWIKKLYRNVQKFALYSIILEFGLIFFLQDLVNFWLNEKAITVNYNYAIVFATLGSIMIYQSVVSTFANGFGKLKVQAICYGVGLIMKIIIIHFMFAYEQDWIIIVFSNIIVLLPYCILQHFSLKKLINKKIFDMESEHNCI